MRQQTHVLIGDMFFPIMRPAPKRSVKPGQGRVRIGEHSSLRKLMRADRRGRVPVERIGVITRAMQSAVDRPEAWINSHARRRCA